MTLGGLRTTVGAAGDARSVFSDTLNRRRRGLLPTIAPLAPHGQGNRLAHRQA
jgi:hypothetical protein